MPIFKKTMQRVRRFIPTAASADNVVKKKMYDFTKENFKNPIFPTCKITPCNISVIEANNENLKGYGQLISSIDEITVENGKFEIKKWPLSGWREMDPGCGDEAGTTEGDFDVQWQGKHS